MADENQKGGLIKRVGDAMRYAVTGEFPTGWFGPSAPLAPLAPANVAGRQFDYQYGININYPPRGGEFGFNEMKRLASSPFVAMLIQRQKDKVASFDWNITYKADKGPQRDLDPEAQRIADFLQAPDREHDWSQWIGAVLDQQMVLDAVTIYPARSRAGGIYALQVLDGATIKPVIDLGGRRPLPPYPAYQQVLKGMPAVDYTSDELMYFPLVYRPDRIYGYSKIEQVKEVVETAILRLQSQKSYFEFGNVGDGYFTAPDNFTPEQTQALRMTWNNMMLGGVGMRRMAPFLPAGSEWHATKTEVLSDVFDEWLIKLICFEFGIAPQPFLKQTGLGHGDASGQHDAAEEAGLATLMQYVERLMTAVLARWFNRADLQFSFSQDREFDPKTAATIDDIRAKNGSRTINEIRDRNGEAPVENGDKPMLYTASGWVLLEEAIKPPPEPLPPVVMHPGLPAAGANGTKTPPAAVNDTNPPPKQLAKASKSEVKAAEQRLTIMVTGYLAKKGKAAADAITGTLFKAAPMDDQSGRIDSAVSSVDWEWDDLPAMVQPVIAGVAVAAGQDAVNALGSSLFDADTLKRVSARATAYAKDRSAELVGMKWVDGNLVTNPNAEWSIADTTRKQIRSLIEQAMSDGQSNDQLAKAIRESATFGTQRAETIARTETANADVRGAAAGWIESGIVHSAQFDASPDCCEECQAEDGKIVPLAEADDLDLPHPDCRCSFSAVLDGEDDSQGDDNE